MRQEKTARTLVQLSNTYTLTARGYELWRTRALSLLTGKPFPLERELALMLSWTQPTPGERWLDVGTSTGIYARALASRGANVVGLDFSKAMLEVASHKTASPLVVYQQGYLETASLETFDGIAVGATLNEFLDTQVALRRMAALLKPGGRLFLMYLTGSESGWGRALQAPFKATGVRFPARPWVREALERAGLHYRRGERHGVVVLELYQRVD